MGVEAPCGQALGPRLALGPYGRAHNQTLNSCCHPLEGPGPSSDPEGKSRCLGRRAEAAPGGGRAWARAPPPLLSAAGDCETARRRQAPGSKGDWAVRTCPRRRACRWLAPGEAAYLLNFQPAHANQGTYRLALGHKRGEGVFICCGQMQSLPDDSCVGLFPCSPCSRFCGQGQPKSKARPAAKAFGLIIQAGQKALISAILQAGIQGHRQGQEQVRRTALAPRLSVP